MRKVLFMLFALVMLVLAGAPYSYAASVTEYPVVGAVTTNSAKIALRTDSAASVVVEYDTSSSFTNPTVSNSITTASTSDYTAIFSLSSLSANTTYYYRVKVGGVLQSLDAMEFSTFPASGSYTFSVFADVAPTDSAATAYAGAANTLFAVQLGDFDHGDPTTLAASRQMHRDMRDKTKTHGQAFVNRIAKRRALVHMWDDHDYCGNDEDRFCSSRSTAWQAFKEYYPTYTLANGSNGLWHKFTVGDAEFFVLDLRSQRDAGTDTDNSDKSMLDGALITNDQKDWFLDGLKNSTAKWKIVLSTVTFNEDARPASTDIWHSYSTEAAAIKTYLTNNSIEDVVVISADIHTGGGIDDGTNSLIGVPEMTVAHTNLAGGNKLNLGTWSEGVTAGKPGGAGYSTVAVSSTSVVLKAYAANGTLRHSYTVQ